MKANSVLALAIAFLMAVLAGAGFWLKKEVDGTRADLAAMSRQVEAQAAATQSVLEALEELTAAQDEDPLFGETVELRKAADIEARANQLAPDASVEEAAAVLGEVDQWFFSEAEEAAAREKIDEMTDTLRRLVSQRIEPLLADAVRAGTGKDAAAIMIQVNDLLALYPSPVTTSHKDELYELTQKILRTSQRVEEVRRLRYNAWAVNKVETGLAAYKQNKGRLFTDDARLVSLCDQHLGEIDPAFLEPVVLDLYNYVIELTTKKVNDEYRVTLARRLANPNTTRKTPLDF